MPRRRRAVRSGCSTSKGEKGKKGFSFAISLELDVSVLPQACITLNNILTSPGDILAPFRDLVAWREKKPTSSIQVALPAETLPMKRDGFHAIWVDSGTAPAR